MIFEMSLNPRGAPVKAKLVRRAICSCGYGVLYDTVPLGKVYTVWPETIFHGGIGCGGCGKRTDCDIITVDDGLSPLGYLPLDILELEAAA